MVHNPSAVLTLMATSVPHLALLFFKHIVAFWPEIFQALLVFSLPQHWGQLFVQGTLVPVTEFLEITI